MAGKSFSFTRLLITKLWSYKFMKLDVCGRSLFANPVTKLILMHSIHKYTEAASTSVLYSSHLITANLNLFNVNMFRKKHLYDLCGTEYASIVCVSICLSVLIVIIATK